MSNTHYKTAINPDYMGAYSLWNDEADGYIEQSATIKRAGIEPITGKGGAKENRLVVHTDLPKPFICNSGNSEVITKASGSPSYLRWPGTKITLYVIMDQRMKDGTRGPALGVKAYRGPAADYSGQIRDIQNCATLADLEKLFLSYDPATRNAVKAETNKRKGELNENK